jgi:hypothetical protein
MSDAGKAEDLPIALNLVRGAQHLFIVVGEFHSGLAVNIVELANQTYRIEIATALRITVAKIIGQ